MILEIAVFNITSAIIAANAGADRLEICENYANGGTTPSFGTLKTIKEKINIPAFVMICPRAGDFLYSNEEFEIIKKDITLCKELGFDGIVCGILLKDGSIDMNRTSKLVELSYPLPFTFHRAFDRCKDPLQAVENIIECGCRRILTSGQEPTAIHGKNLIKQLIEQANNRIIILPGGGLRSNNIATIQSFTGATEFHSSAKKIVPTAMQYINTKMADDVEIVNADAAEIQNMKIILQS